MSFNDVFQSNFLDNINSVTMFDMVLSLALAFGLGLFIFMIYKKSYSGVMYSSNFGVTLVAMTMISTFVILAVTSNVVLSLGMVGALSIVRFRTAVKDPLDIAFLFWSIAVGIVLAAGMIPLAVFGSIFIGAVFVIFVNKTTHTNPYMVILICDSYQTEQQATSFLQQNVKRTCIKSKTVRKDYIELNIEIRLKDEDTTFVNQLSTIEGVTNATLVSFNGEYMG